MFAENVVYIDSLSGYVEKILRRKTSISNIKLDRRLTGYITQLPKIDDKIYYATNEFLLITISSQGKDILGVSKYGLHLLNYKGLFSGNPNDYDLRKVIDWVFDFSNR